MSFSATHIDKKESKWIRDEEKGTERRKLRVKKPEDFHNDRTKGSKAESRELSPSTSSIPASVAPLLSPAVHARSASSASAAPSHIQRTTYSRPLPGIVAYSQHAVRPVSGAQTQGPTRLNLTTPSHTQSVAHSTHSTYPGSMINDAKSYVSTSSAVQNTVPPVRHSHPPQDVPSPSQNSNGSRTPSVASVAPSTAPRRHPAVLPSRDSSRAPSAVDATLSKVSEIYPSLPPSRDSSCATQSRVPGSTAPASESRLLTYRAPSVVTVTSSTISDQHPLFPASTASSVIHNLQPSRSPSVASVARNTAWEDLRVLPTPASRSSSIAPSGVSVRKESSEYLQERHSRDPSRAPSLQPQSSRAPSSRAPSSRTASVAPSIRSEHTSSIVSTARLRADKEYDKSVISCGPSEVESSARSRRPNVIHRDEEYAAPVSKRAPSIAASTRSSIKSGRNERNTSTASKARSRIHEDDYGPSIQSKSASKRASSIKPSSRSKRGDSTASKARSHVEIDDHESSSGREPTSMRASNKASSSIDSRKASREDRGRSTTSRTGSAQHESVEVIVTYEEHEDDRTKSRARSERSSSASTHRSSSVSSTETIRALRPGKDNALVAFHDNALHTAEASKGDNRRRSTRRKKSSAMSVVSVSTAAGLPVMRPDPSDSEAEQASGKKGQRSHHNNKNQQFQQQQQHRRQYPQDYQQTYPQSFPPQYAQPYPQQQQYFQPQPPTAHGAYGYPYGHPQYQSQQYTRQPYPDLQYTHPQPTAPPYYPATNEPYSSQYMTSEPQPAPYSNLAREHEERKQGWHFPKGWDEAHERDPQPVGKSHRKARYRDAEL